ncbi:MAG: NfeD family protein [Verrucomicrobiota bacterium]|jgi:membrane-bound serine protease (ClpP class)|nr:NfeD family protein [Verrucomicrobiota bacterium]MDP7050172.1 NfeD family protein [Verrucomicrobiota bacterium]
MRTWLKPFAALALAAVLIPLGQAQELEAQGATPLGEAGAQRKVYVVPVRDDIMPPILYVIRRGVKEAMAAEADCLILDMETNGGRVDITEEIFDIVGKFKGETVTYVNKDAYSAGAFIAVATQKIYMAPQSVIGAAAPIMMGPTGGVSEMPSTMEVKINSAIRARIRTQAEKNGYAVDVIEAMVDKSKKLERDGKIICEEGDILTLTNLEAEAGYGEDKTPLLSSGTVESIDALIGELGYAGAIRVDVQPLGVEQLGTWINAISPLLLLIGIIGLYIEFKTPGFGVFGAIGIASLVVYFFGGYVSGLAGIEWVAVFVLGVVLMAVELLWLPGTLVVGAIGVVCMLIALVMGMTDIYPDLPWFPAGEGGGGEGVPQVEGIDFALPDFSKPIFDLTIAFLLSIPVIWALGRYLPHTAFFAKFASEAASGVESVAAVAAEVESHLGQVGESTTPLNPGGKVMLGDDLCDVVTQGEMIAAGAQVKVIGHRGSDLLVVEA